MKRSPRKKFVAYASTGTHALPWAPMDGGRMAIFENYKDALKDSFGPDFVHRVTMYIEREPASPVGKSGDGK